jgi:hypothetical protein
VTEWRKEEEEWKWRNWRWWSKKRRRRRSSRADRCQQAAWNSDFRHHRQTIVFSSFRQKVDSFVNKLKIDCSFCFFDVSLKSMIKNLVKKSLKKMHRKILVSSSTFINAFIVLCWRFAQKFFNDFFDVVYIFFSWFIHCSNANIRVIWLNSSFCCFWFFCQQLFQFFIAARLLFIWMTMFHRFCHSRILEERREIRHECFSWLMKDWVYTIFCLLTHLSYTSRNICNSAFWTIWLRWCFLRSKKLYHLSWTRFELSSYCNFSSLFLESTFNEFRMLVSSSTRVRRDLAQQKRRFWDFFE